MLGKLPLRDLLRPAGHHPNYLTPLRTTKASCLLPRYPLSTVCVYDREGSRLGLRSCLCNRAPEGRSITNLSSWTRYLVYAVSYLLITRLKTGCCPHFLQYHKPESLRIRSISLKQSFRRRLLSLISFHTKFNISPLIMSNKAAILQSKASPLVIETLPIPSPSASEVLIKNYAIATNPVDWKMQDTGLFFDKFPIILGSDVAGTVEAVGPNMTRLKKGDRVSGFAGILISKNNAHAAFQQYTILKEWVTTKLPDKISFEEASLLPMAVATAGSGVFGPLGVSRSLPTKEGSEKGSKGPFIVWGASSSVGSAALQMAVQAGYTVYAVNSPRHNEYIKSLGATQTFDYKDPDIVSKIISTIKSTGGLTSSSSAAGEKGTVLAYDAISESNSPVYVAEIISSLGGGKLLLTIDYPSDAPKYDNVEIGGVVAAMVSTPPSSPSPHFPTNDNDNGGEGGGPGDLGKWLFVDYLEKTLADGSFVPSPKVLKFEGGVEGIQKALDRHRDGVSGVKPVVVGF